MLDRAPPLSSKGARTPLRRLTLLRFENTNTMTRA